MLPKDLLTEDDVKRLVIAASSPRNKAFIITLYESGARIGEIGSMQIRDVVFDEIDKNQIKQYWEAKRKG